MARVNWVWIQISGNWLSGPDTKSYLLNSYCDILRLYLDNNYFINSLIDNRQIRIIQVRIALPNCVYFAREQF